MSLIELKSLGSGSDLWMDEGDYIYPDNAPAVVITDTGRLGINETAPETLIELTHTAPYITLHNSSAEDTAGGRESRIIVKGHQSGNKESTLGYLECSHDGSSDDQKAKWTLYGNDGTDDDAPTKRLLIDSNGHLYIYSPTTSDYVRLYHDDTNTYMRWNDGVLILQTDEGTNSVTDIQIRGKGGQSGRLRLYDEDDAEYLQFFMSLGRGYFKVTGAAPSVLMFQDTADVDITCFENASEGETKEFKIYGYRAGDSLLSLEIGVGVDAADTASFDGLANYWFDGNLKVNGITQLGDGGTDDYAQFAADGELTLHGTARAWKCVDLFPNAVKLPAADPPANDEYQGFSFHRFDRGTEEQVYYIWHIPADFATGDASVRGHFGLMVENPPAGGGSNEAVVMGFEYKKISCDDVFDFASGTSGGTLTETIEAGEAAYKWHCTDTGACTTTGWAAEDIVLFRFYRDATNGDDTYDNEAIPADNDVWVGIYHLEYLRQSLGEASEASVEVESQINTENRRRAASGFFMFLLSPVPDGDIDTADDRYHNAGLYRSFS